MNPFTILRHPITTDFQLEELERIPEVVIKAWWQYAQQHEARQHNRARIPCDPARIHHYLKHSTPKQVKKPLLDRLLLTLDNHYASDDMSLFSSIKYPISYPPTKDELESLPTAIYEKWLSVFGPRVRELCPPPRTLAASFNCAWELNDLAGIKRFTAYINDLKKLIYEYEE